MLPGPMIQLGIFVRNLFVEDVKRILFLLSIGLLR